MDALVILFMFWIFWRANKEKSKFMAAIDNLKSETTRLSKIADALVAAPKGVAEADVQAQADVVKAANDKLEPLVPAAPVAAA